MFNSGVVYGAKVGLKLRLITIQVVCQSYRHNYLLGKESTALWSSKDRITFSSVTEANWCFPFFTFM